MRTRKGACVYRTMLSMSSAVVDRAEVLLGDGDKWWGAARWLVGCGPALTGGVSMRQNSDLLWDAVGAMGAWSARVSLLELEDRVRCGR